jgi:enoyl-CoA hydratase/carnithine racemase
MSKPYTTLSTELTAGGILVATFNRPEQLNTFNAAMAQDIMAAVAAADADDAVRAIVFTGAGRAFCAGADLGQGEKTFDYAARSDRPPGPPLLADGSPDLSHPNARDLGGRVTLRLFASLKPIVGAINGPAVGIGATMLLPMDVLLAADTARFGFVFTRRGIVPEACSSWFLPRRVGIARALEWTISGRVFPAQEALEAGLVRRLLPAAELLPAALALARELTESSAPVSVALTRQMMWRMLGAAHPMEAHRVDSRGIYTRGAAADVREGVTAFLEKRPAQFADRVSQDLPAFYPWWDEPEYR